MDMYKCKKKLGVLWLLGGGIIFLILFGQSIFGQYSDQIIEAWQWFLPTVMPTLSLIVSAWVADARGTTVKNKPINTHIYNWTRGLSVFYLSIVLLSILSQPFVQMSPVKWLNLSNLWLGPLQSLVIAATGIFFIKTDIQPRKKS